MEDKDLIVLQQDEIVRLRGIIRDLSHSLLAASHIEALSKGN